MTASDSPAMPVSGTRLPSTPPLALLLDVDGPVASPVTRDVKPDIILDLVALAAAGIPVIFNTGRSDAFIREQVMEPMIAAGIPAGTVIHAVCEKGAVWFSYTNAGAGPIHVDRELAVPAAYGDDIRRLVAEDYAAHMFFDETKRAMVSVEQHIDVPSAEYLAEQKLFDADAMELMGRHGLGVVRLDHHAPNSDDAVDYRVDPSPCGWARTSAPAARWNCWPPRGSRRRPGGRWAIPGPTTRWPTGCTTTTTRSSTLTSGPRTACPANPTRSSRQRTWDWTAQ